MNKMLRALKKLQATSASGGVRPQRVEVAAIPVDVEEATPDLTRASVADVPRREAIPAFDAASFLAPSKGPAYVMREIAKKSSSTTLPPQEAAPVAPASARLQPPEVPPNLGNPGYESHWERSAKNDLSAPGVFEAFQAIAQQIRRDLPGPHPRCVLFAGVGCGELEVAETALRVSMLFAVDGRKTCLIDADLNHPLSNALLREVQPGLSEILLENVPTKHFLLPTATTDLFFLSAGSSPQLLDQYEPSSLPMNEVLAQIREECSLAIVAAGEATGPLTRSLGRSCDAAYLLVRLGVATAQQAHAARTALQDNGTRLLGCIAIDG